VRKNLSGWNSLEQFPINGNESPRSERGDSGNQCGSLVRLFEAFRGIDMSDKEQKSESGTQEGKQLK